MGFLNVAPKKEMFFIYHFPKENVGRTIQNAVNTKLYVNSKILSAVYLYSHTYRLPLPMKQIYSLIQWMKLQFLEKICFNKLGFSFCYISLKIR